MDVNNFLIMTIQDLWLFSGLQTLLHVFFSDLKPVEEKKKKETKQLITRYESLIIVL